MATPASNPLPDRPDPTRPGTGEAVEVDRTINASGLVALGGQQYSVGY